MACDSLSSQETAEFRIGCSQSLFEVPWPLQLGHAVGPGPMLVPYRRAPALAKRHRPHARSHRLVLSRWSRGSRAHTSTSRKATTPATYGSVGSLRAGRRDSPERMSRTTPGSSSSSHSLEMVETAFLGYSHSCGTNQRSPATAVSTARSGTVRQQPRSPPGLAVHRSPSVPRPCRSRSQAGPVQSLHPSRSRK